MKRRRRCWTVVAHFFPFGCGARMMELKRVRSFQPRGEFLAVREAMGSKAWRYLMVAYLGMQFGLTRNPVWKKARGSSGKRLARFSKSCRYCSGVGLLRGIGQLDSDGVGLMKCGSWLVLLKEVGVSRVKVCLNNPSATCW